MTRPHRSLLPFLYVGLLYAAAALAASSAVKPARPSEAARASVTEPVSVPAVAMPAAPDQPAKAAGDEHWLARLVERLRPAVVSVQSARPATAMERVAGSLGGGDGGGDHGLASGFLLAPDGLVATAAHAVRGATTLRVVLTDGRSFRARIIGVDAKTDVALIKLDGARDLPWVTLGDSDRLAIGDTVVAIGNPFGLGSSVTAGIVSAKNRDLGEGPYDDYLQTDAPINPGNSGGPLFDTKGRVVGINTAVVADGQGIGFAVPISTARPVLKQLQERGHMIRGWIGIEVQDLTPALAEVFGAPAAGGALVTALDPGAPADKAGVKIGDVILVIDKRQVHTAALMARVIAETAPGSRVAIQLLRDGRARRLSVRAERLDETSPDVPKPPDPAAIERRLAQGLRGLGARVQPQGETDGGLVVVDVEPDSPLGDALAPGDVVLEIDRRPVRRPADADAAVRAHRGPRPLLLRIRHEGATVFVPIDLL